MNSLFAAVVAFLLAATQLSVALAGGAITVTANEEQLIGERSKQVGVFRGIPFAQPPLGKLRWQAPLPPAPRAGWRQATDFADACMQGPHIVDWYQGVAEAFDEAPDVIKAPNVSEDCLYLNIWTPALNGSSIVDKALPVMVWIHGGSNKGGWAFEPNYIGEQLARQNVVVVSIAYRLGVFGFFSHPQLSDQQAVSANFGLLDQIAALHWVQENIRQFGGDPNRVTVFGESAGAADIAYLMTSPLSEGLFQRAIHQSAGFEMVRQAKREHVESLGLKLGAHLSIDNETEALSKLRAVPADKILAAAEVVYKDHYHDPVIDNYVLNQAPLNSFANNQQYPVDLMIGTNAHEWYMYIDEDVDKQAIDEYISQQPEAQRKALWDLIKSENDLLYALDRLTTGKEMLCPSLFMARQLAGKNDNTWFYFFSKQRDGPGGKKLKAYHGAEIAYVFDTHDEWLPTRYDDRKLTKIMLQYWSNFAKTGNPNTKGLPRWPRYIDNKVIELGKRVNAIGIPEKELCELFDRTRGNNSNN
ncbi:MAG: carboxylesterase/lipase family protein [Pseudomonadales bacterium]